ncbi:hypothetical protein ACFQE1_14720, partial [Halobium palmae]
MEAIVVKEVVGIWTVVGVVVLSLLIPFVAVPAGASAGEGRFDGPSIESDITCRLDLSEDTVLSLEGEALCEAIRQARDEAAAETIRTNGEISEINHERVDYQNELTENCPQDLSIIACTAQAVDEALSLHEEEMAQLKATNEAARARWNALTAEYGECYRAQLNGESYEPDPENAELIASIAAETAVQPTSEPVDEAGDVDESTATDRVTDADDDPTDTDSTDEEAVPPGIGDGDGSGGADDSDGSAGVDGSGASPDVGGVAEDAGSGDPDDDSGSVDAGDDSGTETAGDGSGVLIDPTPGDAAKVVLTGLVVYNAAA